MSRLALLAGNSVARILMLRRLVGYPELGSVHGKASHHCASVVDTEQYVCAEGRLVEVNGLRSVADGEHGRNGGLEESDGLSCMFWMVSHDHLPAGRVCGVYH